MTVERLSPEAIQKVSGSAWEPLRETFFEISRILLSVSGGTAGVLTTIYVKYQISPSSLSSVYSVVWLKNSKQLVVGLSLPDAVESERLGPAPKGMSYKGITKYLTLMPGDEIPSEMSTWAEASYRLASSLAEG